MACSAADTSALVLWDSRGPADSHAPDLGALLEVLPGELALMLGFEVGRVGFHGLIVFTALM